MTCMANILHRLIWVKFMSMLSMYVQSIIWDTGIFTEELLQF